MFQNVKYCLESCIAMVIMKLKDKDDENSNKHYRKILWYRRNFPLTNLKGKALPLSQGDWLTYRCISCHHSIFWWYLPPIFGTMNDRGLTPWKCFLKVILPSKVRTQEQRDQINALWKRNERTSRIISEAHKFLSTWLRAKYAFKY
jgi:hypothetical protein